MVEKFWTEVTDFLQDIMNVHIPQCPVVCILRNIMEIYNTRTTQCIVALAFLSVKRTTLMNWKIHKTYCYNKKNLLKDFLDLLLMESTASTILDYYNGVGAL